MHGNGADAIKVAIEGMMTHHFGLDQNQVAKRLVCFGADGVFVFHGISNGVMVYMKEHMTPFMFDIHCHGSPN